MRLNDKAIQKLPLPETGQKTYFDDTLGGFGVRVSHGGAKSFIIMYGKQRRLRTIGRYPSKTLKIARQEAKTFLATLSPDTSNISVNDALSAFLIQSEAKNRPTTVRNYRYLLETHLPKGKLAQLNRRQLLSHFQTLSNTPGMQAHAVSAAHVFLNWCVLYGYLDYNPIAGVRGIGHINQRTRIFSEDEIKLMFHHAKTYPFGTILLLLLLTGQRRGEIAHLKWDYIKDDTITLPATLTKNKRDHTFPYGHFTRTVLDTIPHREEYLFPSRGKKVWSGWSRAKIRFDEPLNIPPYTIHDLRRTYASVHAQLGTPIHVVEKLLNHVSGSFGGIVGVYQRYEYAAEMKAATTVYEDYLSTLTKTG